MLLYAELNEFADGSLVGTCRERAESVICERHYTRSVPSGKSRYYYFGGALVVYSIPANKNVGTFLLGREGAVWELTRLWAPDGHERDLLTRAISASVGWFRRDEPSVEALVSYADPNVGHEGTVYRAASWLYTGQSEESRYYVAPDGTAVARRKFHSGDRGMKKAEIEALGYAETSREGKHRFARGLTRHARRDLLARWATHPKEVKAMIQAVGSSAAPPPSADSLQELARKINAAHAEREARFRSSLESARDAGLLLIQARRRVDGHEWLAWLDANTNVTPRAAQQYVRVAKNWDKINSKCEMISHLGLAEALKLIATPKGQDDQGEGKETPTPFLKLVKTWEKADAEQRAAFLSWLREKGTFEEKP